SIAGSLLAKNTQENTANSLKTDNLTFMFVLVCIIYIFAALTFFSSAYFIKRCRIFIFMALRRVNV
ncbi:potassium-transporting ATPase subunit KdpA, partial [Campylobacter jejuni]|nr:potassium-transporting ATPase subunit KdpA [Campylobacter jejuni]